MTHVKMVDMLVKDKLKVADKAEKDMVKNEGKGMEMMDMEPREVDKETSEMDMERNWPGMKNREMG